MPLRITILHIRTAVLFSSKSCFSTSSMARSRSYADAVGALNSLQTPFAVIQERKRLGIRLDETAVPEMRQFLARTGHAISDLDRLQIVHVAGTKGKGTTCAYVQAILTASQKQHGAPRKIGLYTSPHLVAVRERIRIDGEPISEAMFARYFFEVWDALEASARRLHCDPTHKPVYFRFLTLLSLHIFLREDVDAAIYEVGVGGAWDSTNVIERPAVTGITTLGIDHVAVLGDTVEKIAWHKAGIFKTGAPAFTVRQVPGAAQVLVEQAAEKQVDLKVVDVHPALKGVKLVPAADFQRQNASLALALAECVLQKFQATALMEDGSIAPEVREALEQTKWRGRCEVIPMGSQTWYLDGAHTADSLVVSGTWFASEVSKKNARKVLIFNQQSRPEAVSLLQGLQKRLQTEHGVQFEHVIFCTNTTRKSTGHPKDLENMNTDPNAIANLSVQKACAAAWRENDTIAKTHAMGTIQEAIEFVEELAPDTAGDSSEKVQIFVTGSIHLVGGVLSILEDVGAPAGTA